MATLDEFRRSSAAGIRGLGKAQKGAAIAGALTGSMGKLGTVINNLRQEALKRGEREEDWVRQLQLKGAVETPGGPIKAGDREFALPGEEDEEKLVTFRDYELSSLWDSVTGEENLKKLTDEQKIRGRLVKNPATNEEVFFIRKKKEKTADEKKITAGQKKSRTQALAGLRFGRFKIGKGKEGLEFQDINTKKDAEEYVGQIGVQIDSELQAWIDLYPTQEEIDQQSGLTLKGLLPGGRTPGEEQAAKRAANEWKNTRKKLDQKATKEKFNIKEEEAFAEERAAAEEQAVDPAQQLTPEIEDAIQKDMAALEAAGTPWTREEVLRYYAKTKQHGFKER